MNQRIEWIDTAKAVGIFLVIFGHLSNPIDVTNFVYSFHMPLFFFLSGMTFSQTHDVKQFLRKKVRSILVPYVVFGFVTYIFWFFIGRKFGADSALNIEWWRPILGMLYSNGINNWLAHNTPIWFLTCLFVSEIFLLIFLNCVVEFKLVVLIFISFMGFLISLSDFPRLPWSLNIVPQALFFLGMGFLLKNKIVINFSKLKSIVFILSMLVATAISSLYNGRVDMNGNHYGNFILFLISSLCGICAVVLLSKATRANTMLAFVGKNTLVIFLLHGVALSVTKGVLRFVFGVDLSILD